MTTLKNWNTIGLKMTFLSLIWSFPSRFWQLFLFMRTPIMLRNISIDDHMEEFSYYWKIELDHRQFWNFFFSYLSQSSSSFLCWFNLFLICFEIFMRDFDFCFKTVLGHKSFHVLVDGGFIWVFSIFRFRLQIFSKNKSRYSKFEKVYLPF